MNNIEQAISLALIYNGLTIAYHVGNNEIWKWIEKKVKESK